MYFLLLPVQVCTLLPLKRITLRQYKPFHIFYINAPIHVNLFRFWKWAFGFQIEPFLFWKWVGKYFDTTIDWKQRVKKFLNAGIYRKHGLKSF